MREGARVEDPGVVIEVPFYHCITLYHWKNGFSFLFIN